MPVGLPLPTIEDVAAAAHVSKTTVSHVLSGKRPVAAATQAKVRRVIEELGFRPSALARGLTSARSHTLALMVPDVTNPFYPELARGLQEAVRAAGLLVLLADTGNSAQQERAFLIEALERRVDGIVLSSFGLTNADLTPAVRQNVAMISVGPQLAGEHVDVVSADDRQIGRDAVDHLADRGHTRIATIAGPLDVHPGLGRFEGFRDQMKVRGLRLPESRVVASDFTREGGRTAMERLLKGRSTPTAVFAANDLRAIGALDAARAAGLATPGEIAVLGVDDIDAASLVSPALSTIRIPSREIGHAAGRLLVDRIDGALPTARRTVLVAHQLVVRETT
ncbi:MAG TPA: LacI family DNA-binding transcriptional regulator [Baekduia sp.]